MKPNEEFARIVIQRELGTPVWVNDDNSADSMYDLRIGTQEEPEVAIECVGAVNPKFAESWNIGPAKGAFVLDGIDGDWIVEVSTEARIKTVRAEIKNILQRLERAEIYCVNESWCDVQHEQLVDDLESLGISSAHRVGRPDPSGKVYLTLPGIGGAVDGEGSQIPDWITEFLSDSRRADVLHKLKLSRAAECHVFVSISFSGAPFSVESYFSGDLNKVPERAPVLPPPVDCVWISGMGKKGIRWNSSEWRFFATG